MQSLWNTILIIGVVTLSFIYTGEILERIEEAANRPPIHIRVCHTAESLDIHIDSLYISGPLEKPIIEWETYPPNE